MRIVLIEPDRVLAATYAQALERRGHTVCHAVSAQMAVHLADEAVPDVVVLELQLPRHNGVEFLYEFRSYGEWLQVPIVVHSFVSLSELSMTADIQTELGIVQALYKPTTSLRQLCDVIEHAVPVVL
jgi:DNA-binding response OmpR family regulator